MNFMFPDTGSAGGGQLVTMEGIGWVGVVGGALK